MIKPEFPRITLPGVEIDPAVRALLDAADEHDAFIRRQQRGMARAMVALGKPVFRSGKPKRKRPTKNVRHMEYVRARATYAFLSGLDARDLDPVEEVAA